MTADHTTPNIFDAAVYIIEQLGKPVSSDRLQILCYFAQCLSLAYDCTPLFPEDFRARRCYPFCTELSVKTGHYTPICEKDVPGASIYLSDHQKTIISIILDVYGHRPLSELKAFAQKDLLWKERKSKNQIIPKSEIETYYRRVFLPIFDDVSEQKTADGEHRTTFHSDHYRFQDDLYAIEQLINPVMQSANDTIHKTFALVHWLSQRLEASEQQICEMSKRLKQYEQKNTARRPKPISTENTTLYRCPSCETTLLIEKHNVPFFEKLPHYCPQCGQAICDITKITNTERDCFSNESCDKI